MADDKKIDESLELNRGFAGGLTYLQIAILLVSLAGLMKQIGFLVRWHSSRRVRHI